MLYVQYVYRYEYKFTNFLQKFRKKIYRNSAKIPRKNFRVLVEKNTAFSVLVTTKYIFRNKSIEKF